MNPILSFDMDGTLVQSGFGDAVWLEGIPRVYAKKMKIPIENAKSFFSQAYDEIGSDKREWYNLCYWIEKYHLSITPQALLDQYQSLILLYPEVESVVQRLSEDFTLIVSSGAMNAFIEKELSYTKIRNYFHSTYSSTSDTNTVKKDPLFYQMITQKLGRKPQDIIHVGDNIDYDYYAPKKAGLQAFFLNRNSDIRNPNTISSLEEFETIIYDRYQ